MQLVEAHRGLLIILIYLFLFIRLNYISPVSELMAVTKVSGLTAQILEFVAKPFVRKVCFPCPSFLRNKHRQAVATLRQRAHINHRPRGILSDGPIQQEGRFLPCATKQAI